MVPSIALNSIFTYGLKTLIGVLNSRSTNDINIPLPPLVPAVHSFVPSAGSFKLPDSLSILVDQDFVSSTKDNGLTLIPPSLLSFAQTFASDFQALFPTSSIRVSTVNAASLNHFKDYVFFTLRGGGNHTLASSATTTEGYEMDVSSTGVAIHGSGAKGAFWATRTLLQGFVLGNGRFPNGLISDQPDWETRGIMLGLFPSYNPCWTDTDKVVDPRCWTTLVSSPLPQGSVRVRLMVQD